MSALTIHKTGGTAWYRVLKSTSNATSRVPLICCHATGLCSAVWRPFLHTLDSIMTRNNGNSIDSVCPDFQSHGYSNRYQGDGNWKDFCPEDINHAIHGSHLTTPVTGIGHSMGGAALAFAAIENPHMFNALYLYEPILTESSTPEAVQFLTAAVARRRSKFKNKDILTSYLRSKSLYEHWDDATLHEFITHGFTHDTGTQELQLRCDPLDEAGMYQRAQFDGLFTALDSITCPVHIFVGESSNHMDSYDEDGTISYYRKVIGKFRTGQLHVIPEGNHFFPQEQPTHFATMIAELLSTNHGLDGIKSKL